MIVHQAQGLRARASERKAPRVGRPGVVALVSGKGGVGKSALAVNLAVAAARRGHATLLIDGDVGLANADLLMGWVPRYDFGDCAEAGRSLDEVVCRDASGLELLVVGARRAAVERLGRALAGAADEPLAERIAAKSLTVLDLGAGIGADVLELARHADPVWLVATPEPTSLADAYTTAKRLWERTPGLRLELIVNRAPDRAAGERTHRALERLVQRFLARPLPLRGVLPEDPAMGRAVARQCAVVLDAPDAPIGRRLGWLADSLVEEIARGPSARAAERAGAPR